MNFPKLVLLMAVVLFGTIAIAAAVKNKGKTEETHVIAIGPSVEVDMEEEVIVEDPPEVKEKQTEEAVKQVPFVPGVDRVSEFFNLTGPKLPIVETITYKKKVPWQPGRAAWVTDYAAHYKTSRHFIARSLNGKANYDKQDVSDGDRFNVLKEDKKFEFYLLVDLSSSTLSFYYIDLDNNEQVFIKSYPVGLGRVDEGSLSGFLTPLGKYTLGDRIAVFRPKMMGTYQGERTEMVRIFGTRWIPFGKEIADCTAPAKGFGIHGLPMLPNERGVLEENRDSLGRYESDGCIRLATEDMEELFSIIISRPTTVEIVKK